MEWQIFVVDACATVDGIGEHSFIRYVRIFENRGAMIGASNPILTDKRMTTRNDDGFKKPNRSGT